MSATAFSGPKLRIVNAAKVYNARSGDLLALDRCSLDVEAGEIVSIVGAVGCGKTTVLWSMSGLHPLRGWAMGLEFGCENPRAAVEAVFEQFPSLASNLGPKLGTTSCLQQTNVFSGDMSKRAGWGDHNMPAWQLFFDKIYQLKQITKPVKAEDVCSNALIAGANAFDHAKVKADAADYKLSQQFADLDLDNIKAHLFDQAVPANR